MPLQRVDHVLDPLQVGDLNHVLLVDTQVRQGSAGLLLHAGMVHVPLHGCDDHAVATDAADLYLVRVVVGEVRAREAREVLDARLVGPRGHCVDDHLDGARLEDDSAIDVLHREVAEGAEAVGLDPRVLGVRAEPRKHRLHALDLRDLAAVLVVEREICYSGTTLLTDFGVFHMVLHAEHDERDPPFEADRDSGGRELADVGESPAGFPLYAAVGLEVLERGTDARERTLLDDPLLQALQAPEDRDHLTTALLDTSIVWEGAHRRDDQAKQVAANGR
mmetsp:Transcript_46724/g.130087  ORF Transcript_46724/g.130087 Transcript_46724/m.130087 type:complete len:277 (+) Transcript_46724:417-1247(+)